MSINEPLVLRDFTSFADPATPVGLSRGKISWTQARKQCEATIAESKSGLTITSRGQQYDYAAFFASEEMADLRGLAETTRALIPTFPAYTGSDFVESDAAPDGESSGRPARAVMLSWLAGPQAAPRTKLMFLRGRAGDGKSTSLLHLCLDRAEAVVRGEERQIFFYVNAQGSSLAKIDEVIAKVTQDFGAKFKYSAVSTLTRLGLLVPVIDGFDELLGPSGYKDAFASLALFIRRLDGHGAIIASARSTFYQYSTFGEQAARFASDEDPLQFEIIPLELKPWDDHHAASYLSKKGTQLTVEKLKAALGERSSEVLSSPFLLSHLAALDPTIQWPAKDQDFVDVIVRDLVQREMVEKLLDPTGKPLLTLEQHFAFLGAIAEEMWWLESREIDEGSLGTIAEIVCEQFDLPKDVAVRFVQRAPSYAFLSRLETPPRYSFRHEFYFAYFLARRICSYLINKESIDDLLRRSTMSPVVADEVARTLQSQKAVDVAAAASAVASPKTSLAFQEVAQANAGTLYAAFIVRLGARLSGATFRDGIFNGQQMSGSQLSKAIFQRCVFTECDLTAVKWKAIEFRDTRLSRILISADTVLEARGLAFRGDVIGVRLRVSDGSTKEYFSQRDMIEVMGRAGVVIEESSKKAPEYSERGRALVNQLSQFLRVPQKTLYFSESDFSNYGHSMVGDLQNIVSLLRKHRLLVEAVRQRSGQRKMYRLAEPPWAIKEGEAGVFSSAPVKALWNDLLNA
jgi:hypothetical protein